MLATVDFAAMDILVDEDGVVDAEVVEEAFVEDVVMRNVTEEDVAAKDAVVENTVTQDVVEEHCATNNKSLAKDNVAHAAAHNDAVDGDIVVEDVVGRRRGFH